MRSVPARLSGWSLVLLPMLSVPALAQEFYALGGAQYTHSLDETTYSPPTGATPMSCCLASRTASDRSALRLGRWRCRGAWIPLRALEDRV
jgi:hypothetical protein